MLSDNSNLTPAWRFVIDCLAEYGALLRRTAPKTVVGELGAADLNPARTEQDVCILPEDGNDAHQN